ncbi:MAG: glycosyltransferase, partial [Elusimicrobiota bacterium]|nr:glycosyltransferase [Elusimicrobiota bacterium]
PALQAGLHYVTGDCVGLISADLQDSPELLIEMVKRWETGTKLVIAEREGREESIRQSFISNSYWRLINKFAVPGYPLGGFDFCLADRQVIEHVGKIAEKNSHIFMLMFSLGYSNSVIKYTRKKRIEGVSQWTLIKKVKLVIDTFVAFSYLPIRAMSALGFVAALLGFLYTLFAVGSKLLLGNKYEGWTTIVALISLFGGMALLMLGIIGEYLWRILDETRKRPAYVVDKVVPALEPGRYP